LRGKQGRWGAASILIKQKHWHCPIFLTGKKRLKGEKSMFRSDKVIIKPGAAFQKRAGGMGEGTCQTRAVSLFTGAVRTRSVCHTEGSNVTTLCY